MVRYEDRCCSCAAPGYPCRGDACSRRNVPVFLCDKCMNEIEGDVYEDEGEELCEGCLLDKHRKN